MNKIYIYGKHAVGSALRHAPQAVLNVLLAKSFDDQELRALIKSSGVKQETLDPKKLTSQVEGRGSHQGVVALVSLGQLTILFERFYKILQPTPDTLLVLLSEVQDPHNVGTIIRSATAFGAAGVLLPTHKQAPITGAVVKASAGMAFRVPLVLVENMQQAIAQLKKKGMRVHGLAGEGAVSVAEEQFEGPTLLVLGNEAQGLPPAARVLCDQLISIPMDPRCESLNVSAAAAVALFAWSQKHQSALRS